MRCVWTATPMQTETSLACSWMKILTFERFLLTISREVFSILNQYWMSHFTNDCVITIQIQSDFVLLPSKFYQGDHCKIITFSLSLNYDQNHYRKVTLVETAAQCQIGNSLGPLLLTITLTITMKIALLSCNTCSLLSNDITSTGHIPISINCIRKEKCMARGQKAWA